MTLDSNSGERLVFLVGCPRSGTTWLQRLIASHPDVITGQESHIFSEFVGPQFRMWSKHALSRAEERGGLGPGCYHTEQRFHEILREYALRLLEPLLTAPTESQLFLEKTPGHALYMAEILQILPAARFIHIIRDPDDVVASLLGAARSWGRGWAPTSTARAALLWKRHVSAAMNVGASLGPEQYLEVRYEQLYRQGPEVLREAFRYLGLAVDDHALQQYLLANGADRLRSGGGTSIPLGGAFGGAAATRVTEPRGFIGPARPGVGKRKLNLLQRLIVHWITGATMAALSPGVVPRRDLLSEAEVLDAHHLTYEAERRNLPC